jgi:hypothetical protein
MNGRIAEQKTWWSLKRGGQESGKWWRRWHKKVRSNLKQEFKHRPKIESINVPVQYNEIRSYLKYDTRKEIGNGIVWRPTERINECEDS